MDKKENVLWGCVVSEIRNDNNTVFGMKKGNKQQHPTSG